MNSSNIYLDLVEYPVKEWISIFCDIKKEIIKKIVDENESFIDDKYCLLIKEKLNNKDICVLFYIDTVYPPFDNKIDFGIEIEQTEILKDIINSNIHYIKSFYFTLSKMLINYSTKDCNIPQLGKYKDVKSKIKRLQNTMFFIDYNNLTLVPQPIDRKFIEQNNDIYNIKLDSSLNKQEKEKIVMGVFNKFINDEIRIGINIKILNNIKISSNIKKDLLSNYIVDSDSESE